MKSYVFGQTEGERQGLCRTRGTTLDCTRRVRSPSPQRAEVNANESERERSPYVNREFRNSVEMEFDFDGHGDGYGHALFVSAGIEAPGFHGLDRFFIEA